MKALKMTAWRHAPELVNCDPPEPKAGEVLVRVGAAGICHSDLHLLYDFAPGTMPWQLPMTIGHENAGWIRRAASDDHSFEDGQPVAVYGPWGCGHCRACAGGAENYCSGLPFGSPVAGLGADGGMADLMIVPSERHLVALPDGLAPLEAAPLTDAALTPYHAIRSAEGKLNPGGVAVVIGAGGLGHLAVQILRATTDTSVVAVDTRSSALDLAKLCGADHCIAVADDNDEVIRELSRGVGATAVFDMVGSQSSLNLAARIVAVDGWIGIVGLGGGKLPVGVLDLPFGVTVRATYWGTRPELVDVLALAARGDLRASITTYPLSMAAVAYEDVRQGRIHGRAVVIPDDPYLQAD